MEIVRMALEDARQVGSIRATQWWTYGKEFFQHHIFPQRLREFFKKIGIDVDDCIIVVSEWFHIGLTQLVGGHSADAPDTPESPHE